MNKGNGMQRESSRNHVFNGSCSVSRRLGTTVGLETVLIQQLPISTEIMSNPAEFETPWHKLVLQGHNSLLSQ